MITDNTCVLHSIALAYIRNRRISFHVICFYAFKMAKSKNNSNKKTSKSRKPRKVFHQPYQPQSPMTTMEEILSIDLAYVLFCVLTVHLAPTLWNFMVKKVLQDATSLVVDVYKLLKEMIKGRTSNPIFFSSSDPADLNNLNTALNGRNAVLHGYFDLISLNWKTYLVSWIQVLKMINADKAAAAVQRIHDDLVSKSRTPLDVSITSFSKPAFMSGRPEEHELSREQYIKAIKIKMRLYRCMTNILCPSLRDYYLQKNNQTQLNSELDAQNLLFDLLDEWELMTQHPDHLDNVQNLRTAKDGRNAVSHADLIAILNNWESYLASWIKVCKVISTSNAASEIQAVYDRIKSESPKRRIQTSVNLIKPGRVFKSYVGVRRTLYVNNPKRPHLFSDLY